MSETDRHLFAREALSHLPKLLVLQDRNPHSPTYGCFDRNFWHYKLIDFPSGMAQEFVWPLALAYATPLADNPYHLQSTIKEWVEAGILFAARSAHSDGSCDDYFPFEKAAGAAAFALLACLESYAVLDLHNPELLSFFTKRAEWLASHHESGRLSNHQALIVLCLEKAGRLFSSERWDKLKVRRLKRLFEWQNEEGWFYEYEGCDVGYQTLTIGLLAQLYELHPSTELRTALQKAIYFTSHFLHPDGSFGGEYTSRNTYNFFPHGFEIAGKWLPEALTINDRFLSGLRAGLGPCYADDHIIGHHAWSYLLAHQHFVGERPPIEPRPRGRLHFRSAGIVVERRGDSALYLALNKGGVFKFFHNGRLAHSDTNFSVLVENGRIRNAVAHLVGKYEVTLREDEITIQGRLGWAKTRQMTTFKLLVLRLVMTIFGRFFPDLIRRLLQRMLITGKRAAPLRFTRRLRWDGEHLNVTDELTARSWQKIRAVGIGGAQTSIYVVMSRVYQPGQLEPWLDLTDGIRELGDSEPFKLERKF